MLNDNKVLLIWLKLKAQYPHIQTKYALKSKKSNILIPLHLFSFKNDLWAKFLILKRILKSSFI